MTPNELSDKFKKSSFQNDLLVAFEKLGNEIQLEIDKGSNKMIVPSPKLGNLFYYDDKQKAMAEFLKEKGFKVKRERNVISGVLQDPIWYLYF